MRNISFAFPLVCLLAAPVFAQDLASQVNSQLPGLIDTYKGLHAHPELSHFEERTSALLAAELRKAGYTVTEHVGKYPDGAQAYGIVAILENGPGPRLLIRADMDALPIVEETGVSYASQVKTKNADGQEVGVMHACGHDVHVTTLIGTARALAAPKRQWHGTVILVGQPSEETFDGARAMRGVGGHGANPQLSKDPIVMAAVFIMQLQTIASRQEDPRNPAVVTVGDIHGGTERNIIPDEVKMELTTRAFSAQALQIILDGIRRTAQGVALSAGVPDDRAPIVKVLEAESVPVTYNDQALAARMKATLAKALGPQNVFDDAPRMGSEDFGF
jgi:metal-dependent amidase/aminoacylase/carboxypeptidase family protein